MRSLNQLAHLIEETNEFEELTGDGYFFIPNRDGTSYTLWRRQQSVPVPQEEAIDALS